MSSLNSIFPHGGGIEACEFGPQMVEEADLTVCLHLGFDGGNDDGLVVLPGDVLAAGDGEDVIGIVRQDFDH
jgi:hypothetical protein